MTAYKVLITKKKLLVRVMPNHLQAMSTDNISILSQKFWSRRLEFVRMLSTATNRTFVEMFWASFGLKFVEMFSGMHIKLFYNIQGNDIFLS